MRDPRTSMLTSGRRARILKVGSVVAVSVMFVATTAASAATSDWTAYLHGPRHISYNAAATTFTPTTAGTIHSDWMFTAAGPTQPGQPDRGFAASPTVTNGVVYMGATTGVFYAVDEASGTALWHRLLGYTTAKTCGSGRGITSTATVAPDPSRAGQLTVYVGGGDGYLYALRASDGAVIWRSFVVNTGATQNTGYNWASPTVVGGRVYMGISSACDKPLIRGGIREFDQSSGGLLHTYWSVPRGSIGGSVWTSPASDGASVWATIGNGDGGDSYALVRLDASDLAPQDRWVVPNTAGTDLDWGSSPTLFGATIGGTTTPMVGGCSKNGKYYGLRQNDLASGPVWSRRLGLRGDLPGGTGSCLAAAIWDVADRLLFVGSNTTTIAGATAPGSVRELDPATGSVIWATPLAGGPVMGSPSMSGGGVIAAGTFNNATPSMNRLYLIDAADGSIVHAIRTQSAVFSQPVFADTHLFVATSAGTLTAYGIGP